MCDGQAVSRIEYSDLFNLIGTNFGSGDGSTTFNVPDYRDCFLRGKGTQNNDYYVKQEQGLPNIKGTVGGVTNYSSLSICDGAFLRGNQIYNSSTGTGISQANATFDASKSNPIYGASNEVRPQNFAVNFYIKY